MTTSPATKPPPPVDPALAPVADRLLADARRRAAEIAAHADDEARRIRDDATAQAAAILEQARTEGTAAASRAAAASIVDARRRSRQLVLDARRRAYDDVRCAVETELVRRHDSREAHALRRTLGNLCRSRLGAAATVTADEGCGVTAELGSKRLDLGTAVLVDNAMRSLGPHLVRLWAP